MRRIVSALFFGAFAVACASEDSLNPQPLPPSDEKSPAAGAATGSCSGACCEKPAAGTACADAGAETCTWAVTCPTGLVLPYEVTCTNGTWQVTVDCPKDGENDARGCPARQPENGVACELSSSSSGNNQCGYVLGCTGYRKSALATCSGGTWQTTSLGTCN